MMPAFDSAGSLPPGIHIASWGEIEAACGFNTWRRTLLAGLRIALESLRSAGCRRVYIDGSFVTSKKTPADYDACWDTSGVDPTVLDPVFSDFINRRARQKLRFRGEFFPASFVEGGSGIAYLDFFQQSKDGLTKGIVEFDLESWT